MMKMEKSKSNDEDVNKGQDWIKTGTWLLDNIIQGGIPQGQYNVLVGKSRSGKSMYAQEMYMRQIRHYIISIRRQKIKKIIDLI